jgi:hypothetical protein
LVVQAAGRGTFSRRGNPTLRALLVQVGWMGVRTGTWMKAVCERVRRGSDKRKKIATDLGPVRLPARRQFIQDAIERQRYRLRHHSDPACG